MGCKNTNSLGFLVPEIRRFWGWENIWSFQSWTYSSSQERRLRKNQPMWRLPKKSLFHSKQLPGCYPKSTDPKSVRFTDGCLINQGSSEVMFFFGWKPMRIANVFVSNFGSRIHIRVSLPRVSSHSWHVISPKRRKSWCKKWPNVYEGVWEVSRVK